MTSVGTSPETHRCIGYARRRRGRGGRIIFDRALAEQPSDFWDRVLDASVPEDCVTRTTKTESQHSLHSTDKTESDTTSYAPPTFHDFIDENKW